MYCKLEHQAIRSVPHTAGTHQCGDNFGNVKIGSVVYIGEKKETADSIFLSQDVPVGVSVSVGVSSFKIGYGSYRRDCNVL